MACASVVSTIDNRIQIVSVFKKLVSKEPLEIPRKGQSHVLNSVLRFAKNNCQRNIYQPRAGFFPSCVAIDINRKIVPFSHIGSNNSRGSFSHIWDWELSKCQGPMFQGPSLVKPSMSFEKKQQMLSSSMTLRSQKYEDLKNHKYRHLKDSIFDTNSPSRKYPCCGSVC